MDHGVNTKGRTIYKGPRGGFYVMVGGKKIYKFKRSSVRQNSTVQQKSANISHGVNTKGRTIYKGPRGGFYVMSGGKKIYKFERPSAPKTLKYHGVRPLVQKKSANMSQGGKKIYSSVRQNSPVSQKSVNNESRCKFIITKTGKRCLKKSDCNAGFCYIHMPLGTIHTMKLK
jgi:hypothetical protein